MEFFLLRRRISKSVIMAVGIIGKLLITVALLSIIVYYLRKLRLYLKVSKFPGPTGLPIFGNAFYFIGNTNAIHNKLTELMRAYPSPSRVWLGSRAFFLAHEPEQLKIILHSPKAIEKEQLYRVSQVWVGTGLLTAPAAKWRVHRKLIMPTFHSKILESFVEVFSKQSEILAAQMSKELNGDEFGVFEYVSLCTLDIICETAMGCRNNAQTQENNPYVRSAQRMTEIIYTRAFKLWLHSDFLFNLTKLGEVQRECMKHIRSTTDNVLAKKQRSQGNTNESKNQSAHRKAFLDHLMELSKNGEKFTKKELRDEVNTMIAAGNDTTATAISFVLMVLANYPEIQEKAYRELCEIYGDEVSSKRPAIGEDLGRMKYLERVMKETMRVFPVAPFVVRSITEDLDIGRFTLPKDSSVVVGIFGLHRSDEYWPDPLKFDPDRFLPEQVAERHPYCYIPFSAGPRNCLGIKYAMMSMKVILSTILRRYVLKNDKTFNIEDVELKAEVLLHPVVPIKIKIEAR